MSFSDHQNSVKSFPQRPWNGISQTVDLKISRGSMPPDPPPPAKLAPTALGSRAFSPRFQPPQSQTASYGPEGDWLGGTKTLETAGLDNKITVDDDFIGVKSTLGIDIDIDGGITMEADSLDRTRTLDIDVDRIITDEADLVGGTSTLDIDIDRDSGIAFEADPLDWTKSLEIDIDRDITVDADLVGATSTDSTLGTDFADNLTIGSDPLGWLLRLETGINIDGDITIVRDALLVI